MPVIAQQELLASAAKKHVRKVFGAKIAHTNVAASSELATGSQGNVIVLLEKKENVATWIARILDMVKIARKSVNACTLIRVMLIRVLVTVMTAGWVKNVTSPALKTGGDRGVCSTVRVRTVDGVI